MGPSKHNNPDSKVHGANMGPTWGLSAPDGPHVGPMNHAIRECHLISILILTIKIKRSHIRFIIIMGIPMPGKIVLILGPGVESVSNLSKISVFSQKFKLDLSRIGSKHGWFFLMHLKKLVISHHNTDCIIYLAQDCVIFLANLTLIQQSCTCPSPMLFHLRTMSTLQFYLKVEAPLPICQYICHPW